MLRRIEKTHRTILGVDRHIGKENLLAIRRIHKQIRVLAMRGLAKRIDRPCHKPAKMAIVPKVQRMLIENYMAAELAGATIITKNTGEVLRLHVLAKHVEKTVTDKLK